MALESLPCHTFPPIPILSPFPSRCHSSQSQFLVYTLFFFFFVPWADSCKFSYVPFFLTWKLNIFGPLRYFAFLKRCLRNHFIPFVVIFLSLLSRLLCTSACFLCFVVMSDAAVGSLCFCSFSAPRGTVVVHLPGSERLPGEGNGHLLQCSSLENSWRGARGVQRVRHSWVAKYTRARSFTLLQTVFPKVQYRWLLWLHQQRVSSEQAKHLWSFVHFVVHKQSLISSKTS